MYKFTSFLGVVGVLTLGLSSQVVFSKDSSGFEFDVTPVFGYEFVEQETPFPSHGQRLFYGGRVSAGWRFIQAELEYTRAQDSTQRLGVTYTDKEDRLKMGVLAKYSYERTIEGLARFGVQASQLRRSRSDISTTTVNELEWDPYAGVGFRVFVQRNIYLEMGATGVFLDFPNDMTRINWQTYISASLRLP